MRINFEDDFEDFLVKFKTSLTLKLGETGGLYRPFSVSELVNINVVYKFSFNHVGENGCK